MKWRVVYRKAYNEDGSLFFPEKLTGQFLESAKRSLGSYLFANQYLNEIIPSDLQTFKKDWFRYYERLPKKTNTFIFIDPALSEADTADNTGIVVLRVDANNDWYVEYAKRHRINPTELIKYVFELYAQFKPNIIGIEEIAFQKALLYFLTEEMNRRNIHMPVVGIKYPPQNSKQTRILSLVPRFEFGRIALKPGLTDLELELLQFPRGSHDDLIDALAAMDYIAFPADRKEDQIAKPTSQQDPNYEKWYIQQRFKESRESGNNE